VNKEQAKEHFIVLGFIFLGAILIRIICVGFFPEQLKTPFSIFFTVLWSIHVSVKAEKSGALKKDKK
jgi:hypothetical protein